MLVMTYSYSKGQNQKQKTHGNREKIHVTSIMSMLSLGKRCGHFTRNIMLIALWGTQCYIEIVLAHKINRSF